MKRFLAAVLLLSLLFAASCASVSTTEDAHTPSAQTASGTPSYETSEGGETSLTFTGSIDESTSETDTPLPAETTSETETPTPTESTAETDTPTPTETTAETDTPTPTESITETETPTTATPSEPFVPFTLAFTGDINLAENYKILPAAVKAGRTVEECISPGILGRMRAADLLLVNCESSVSDRGAPLSGKAYTFRTSTKTAAEFKNALGADLIGLANNHVYDYGKDAFLDTIDTFAKMGLPTVGAGRNAAEAYEPYYYEKNGMTVAIIATSRAEKNYYTLVAEENEPGICGCYDEAPVLKKIAEAKTKADFVIVYVHYGYENTTIIEEAQQKASYDFIDAGADLIVGNHSHCLQGIDQYKGKLIFYSLGNYLFNSYTLSTALLELRFDSKEHYTLRLLPAMQEDCVVKEEIGTAKGEEILQSLRKLSVGIAIDKEGYVYNATVIDSRDDETKE